MQAIVLFAVILVLIAAAFAVPNGMIKGKVIDDRDATVVGAAVLALGLGGFDAVTHQLHHPHVSFRILRAHGQAADRVEQSGGECLGARTVRPRGGVGEQRAGHHVAPELIGVDAGAFEAFERLPEGRASDDAARRQQTDAHDRIVGGGDRAQRGEGGGVGRPEYRGGQRGIALPHRGQLRVTGGVIREQRRFGLSRGRKGGWR